MDDDQDIGLLLQWLRNNPQRGLSGPVYSDTQGMGNAKPYDVGLGNSYQKMETKNRNMENDTYANDLGVLKMGMMHPGERMDITDIYRWLQRQQMDELINKGINVHEDARNGLRYNENQQLFGNQGAKMLEQGYMPSTQGDWTAVQRPGIPQGSRGRWM